MHDATPIDSSARLEDALAMVHVAGELDFFWRWRIETALLAGGEGWLISAEYVRPDRESGAYGWGTSRPLFVRRGAQARDVWGTAFTAIKLTLEHELLEGFKVDGRRVFDPHGPMLGDPTTPDDKG